jgi:hypothetical protein
MHSNVFLFRVFLSFLVGGLYIGLMTRVSEKFGSKIGGLLIALPSIVLVGLVFIAITQGKNTLVAATTIMPANIAASTTFLVVFVLAYRYGLFLAYMAALLVWFAITITLISLGLHSMLWPIVVALFLFAGSLSFFHQQPHVTLPHSKFNKQALLFRSAFAGTFVALAVLLAKLLGAHWGGLFASFPAAFSSTVLLLAPKHGIKFTASLSRAMVNGALANVVFVMAIYALVPVIGVITGMLLAYFICLAFALFSYQYIMPRV